MVEFFSSKSAGPSSSNKLPDLNNPVASIIIGAQYENQLFYQNSLLESYVDIVRASNQGRRKHNKSAINIFDNVGSSDSGIGNHSSQPSSSSSDEVCKTIDVGCALGFQMHGADDAIR
ncbi:hypothetical protein L2E82_42409 [Cichorium intybus]|uniref:Uncharacterized protein n=1 Tax=Cichorium intybus TaxID=13427 RepID=A0ACB8ZMW8_CICIN|nr:hypothetical protein L2E82_42409 [Cichorium intybus]